MANVNGMIESVNTTGWGLIRTGGIPMDNPSI